MEGLGMVGVPPQYVTCLDWGSAAASVSWVSVSAIMKGGGFTVRMYLVFGLGGT